MLLAYGLAGTPLLALPALVMAAVMMALGRRARARPARTPAAGGAPRRADDWRSFGWLTGLVVIRSVLYFGVSSLVALYVIDRFGLPASAGAAALTTFLGVGALGTLAGGWLADRWGRVPAIRLGYAVALPGLGLLVAAPSWPVALAATVLLGIGLYLPFSVQTTLGQELLPNRIGTASGVTLGLAVTAGGVATPLFGMLADAHGLVWSVAALLPLPLLALLVSLRCPHGRRPRPDRRPVRTAGGYSSPDQVAPIADGGAFGGRRQPRRPSRTSWPPPLLTGRRARPGTGHGRLSATVRPSGSSLRSGGGPAPAAGAVPSFRRAPSPRRRRPGARGGGGGVGQPRRRPLPLAAGCRCR
ncbi:MAG: MFS transporter [Actinomycetota bacterium]|nr:MFS transporter [Actinomycetota bacterium]